MTLSTHLSVVESNRARLREGLDELMGQPSRDETPAVRSRRLRVLLEALPLRSTDLGLAVNRLANAQHYLESGEHGASFDLRLLRQSPKQ
jgi:hypothetical protein